jgi:hypothetical protein
MLPGKPNPGDTVDAPPTLAPQARSAPAPARLPPESRLQPSQDELASPTPTGERELERERKPQPEPPAPWTATPPPGFGPIAQAGAGFLLLGLAGAAGKGSLQAGMLLPLVILGLAILPGIIAAPALLVLHQHKALAATPTKLLHALTEAWMESGRLAGGLASVVLFFALTSLMGTELMFYGLALAGWLGLGAARRRLRQVEYAAGGAPRRLQGLLWTWTLLTTLIGARLGWMGIRWLQELS